MWRFGRKIHPTWLFTVFCGSVLVAIALSQVFPAGMFNSWVWLVSGILLAVFALLIPRRYMLMAVILAGFMVGLWRGSLERQVLTAIKGSVGVTTQVSGIVAEDTDTGKGGTTVLRLKNLQINDKEVAGKIWVSIMGGKEIRRSDHVLIEGKLSEGFGSFSGSMFRAKVLSIERPIPGDVALEVRDRFADKVRDGIDEPMASLGLGYLLGQRRALPPDLDEALKIAGLTHIVVASGYNLTILVRFARRIFARISKYLATIVPLLLVVCFIAVTGLSPSMSRAGLVAGLSLAAWYYGRKFHPITLLSFAACVTALFDPSYVWGDIGWELSFLAFGGVMILAPLLQAYFYGDKKPGTVRQILGETVSAQIVTAPVIVAAFGVFSLVAPLSNLLILPLVPLAMALTFVTGLGAIIAPGFADIVGWPAETLLNYMVRVAEWTAELPWAQLEIKVGVIGVVAYYLILLLVCIYMRRVTGLSLRSTQLVE